MDGGFCVLKVLGKSNMVPALIQYETVITVHDMEPAPKLTGKAKCMSVCLY